METKLFKTVTFLLFLAMHLLNAITEMTRIDGSFRETASSAVFGRFMT
jgi:hypothetical protein